MKTLRRAFLIFAAALVGCSTPVPHGGRLVDTHGINPEVVFTNVLAEVQAIRFNDGVDALEANVLAGHYFRNTYGGCGDWGPARERDRDYYFPCASGFVATSKHGITVAKQGLLITCRSGPVVTNVTLLAKPFDPAWRMSPLNRQRR